MPEPATAATPVIDVRSVTKSTRELCVLDNITMQVRQGELVALLGTSGSGKSTLLHLIAGLERPNAGHIQVYGRTVRGPGPDRAIVFQNNALFPWLTVRQNITVALSGALPGLADEAKDVLADRAIRWAGLWAQRNRKPGVLTSGQQRCLAIARAVAVMPRVLLLDEPFSTLDLTTRSAMHDGLLAMLRGQANPVSAVVLATHDLDEVARLADRVIVLRRGPAANVVHVLHVHGGGTQTTSEDRSDASVREVTRQLRELLSHAAQPLDEVHT